MATVEGLKKLHAALDKAAKRYVGGDPKPSVTVGFTQNYALYVHENEEANHPVGQSKYLEQPAREQADEISAVVVDAMMNGATLDKALLLGGLRLQREAQLLTPVDTGALKVSAFTAYTRNEDVAAQEAYQLSEQVRARAMEKRERARNRQVQLRAEDWYMKNETAERNRVR